MEFLQTHFDLAAGVIWMLVLGPAVGNYACSVIYRLPRAQTPFERHPFCGHCNRALQPIDLFPILSWCATRGRCRYCRGEIPALYTIVELACGAVFVGYFLHFGIGEPFLLFTAAAVFLIILAAIEWQQRWLAASIYSYAWLLILLARTVIEGSIYPTIQGSLLMLMAMVALWRAGSGRRETRAMAVFEKNWIWWFVLLGALVPMPQWPLLLPVYALKLLVPKPGRLVVYATVALCLPVLVW